MMLKRSLVIMEAGMHDGIEIMETRSKKIEKMQRAIKILENITDDCYIGMAEAELGEIVRHDWEFEEVEDSPGHMRLIDKDTPEEAEHNRKVFARSRELETAEWKELWIIFQGQDYDKFNKETDWNKQFDGTGIQSWWD